MAKGKRSVALFEVIQSANTARKDAMFRTPSWWFKRRAPGAISPQPEVEAPGTAPAPRSPGVDLKLDPDRQRITLRFSYTSAAVALFAIVVIVGMAMIIGQHMARGPVPVMAGATTEQIRSAPAKPEVLNVTPPNPSARRAGQVQQPGPAADAGKAVATSTPPQPTAAPPPTTSPSGQRIIGLNYTIVQAYPPAEKAMALEACELLNKNGVACTVETEVPGYYKEWYVVVGTAGFQRPNSDPTYERYEQSIRELSDKFARNSKFKRFAPRAQKWTGPARG